MPTTNPRAMERMPTDRATTPRSRQSVRGEVGGVTGIVFPRINEPADASSQEKRGTVGSPAQRYLVPLISAPHWVSRANKGVTGRHKPLPTGRD
jgi:hypothetical protein